jgi:hypothetical protein
MVFTPSGIRRLTMPARLVKERGGIAQELAGSHKIVSLTLTQAAFGNDILTINKKSGALPMKRSLLAASVLALGFYATVFLAVARQATPLLPSLPSDAAGRLEVARNELFPAEFAIAVAAAARSTDADPAFLFALAARSRFAADTYGASAGGDPDAPVGGPYAYGSAHWLNDLAMYGKDAGYPELAMAVKRLPSGVLMIEDPELRFRAMTARTDPYLSSFLAAKAWQRARRELGSRRAPSDGLVMITFLGGVQFAEMLAARCDKDRAELLERGVRADRDVLLIMTGLPARDARTDTEWTIGNFVDELTELLRNGISAYSAARRIDVPESYRPRKPLAEY